MKAGVGCSYDKDAVKAASGAAAAAVGQSGEPVLTILFTTDSYDQEAVLAEVRRVTGGGHLVGFCCGGVIHGEHICTQGVGVCTLAGDELQAAVVLQEDITQGERVREYVVEALFPGGWKEICAGSCIGHKRIETFAPVETARLRLRVTRAAAEPMIRNFAVHM